MKMSISRMMCSLTIALVCVGVQAQPLTVADESAGVAEARAPQSRAPAPANDVAYRSALTGYRAYQDESVAPWAEANEQVRQIGGWQAYGRESREALRAPAPQSQRPAGPPSPSADGHDAHHGAPK
jgi:hypothetical protein